eukprot:CAMPEP_0114244790 /NCGR_PEP_ID=MMETSP0058-20121206/11533_1 /TAXON_ID=36894 /ORGANISM="Pyramimonas parkeae, CCMP726" /LENGTH=932 /DNA_ID=CAMNT_0001357765 /DNA_START=602 /DNA_END=3400 /DNA_ORIENTATION=+
MLFGLGRQLRVERALRLSCFRGARRIHDSARTRTRQEHTIIKASNQLWEVAAPDSPQPLASVAADAASPAAKSTRTVASKDGESLLSLASRFGVPVEELCKLNPKYATRYASRLVAGSLVKVPNVGYTSTVVPPPTPPPTPPSKVYSMLTFCVGLAVAFALGVSRLSKQNSNSDTDRPQVPGGTILKNAARQVMKQELDSASAANTSLLGKVGKLESDLRKADGVVSKLRQQMVGKDAQLEANSKRLRSQEEKISALATTIKTREEEIKVAQDQVQDALMSSETAQKKESLLLEKIDSLQCEVQALSLAKQVLQKREDLLAGSRDHLTGEIDRMRHERARLDGDLGALRKRTAELTQLSEKLQASYDQSTAENSGLRAKLERSTAQRLDLQRQIASQELETQDMNQEVQSLIATLEAMQASELDLQTALETSRGELADMAALAEARLEEVNNQLRAVQQATNLQSSLQAQVAGLTDELTAEREKLASLEAGRGGAAASAAREEQLIRTAEEARVTSQEAREQLDVVTLQMEEQRELMSLSKQVNQQLEEQLQRMELEFAAASIDASNKLEDVLQRNEKLESQAGKLSRQVAELKMARSEADALKLVLKKYKRQERESRTEVKRAPPKETIDSKKPILPEVSMPSTSNGDIANPIPSSSTSKPGLQLVMAASSIPHPKKASFGGEDAYFIDHDALAMGVADGVGGWSQDGVTSKEYAMQFMQKCNVHLPIPATEDANSKYPYDGLRQSLQMAHNEVNIPGSTTVCILQVDPWTSILHAANVGDSGFRVIRSGEVVCSSNIQEVTWNMPFQFGSPNHLPDTNVADDADLLTFELQSGDVVVLGTDGLFDNCYDQEVCEIAQELTGDISRSIVQLTADEIVKLAHTKAQNNRASTPWSQEVMKYMEERQRGGRVGVMPQVGGKVDDITVVLGFVR